MRNFQKKRRWRNILESWPILGFLGFLVLFFAWSVIGFLVKMEATRENRKLIEAKVVQLEEEKEKLSADIEKLKTDEGKEQSIREKFGLAKEGEGQIVIIEDKNKTEEENKKFGGFFSFLFFWNWFK